MTEKDTRKAPGADPSSRPLPPGVTRADDIWNEKPKPWAVAHHHPVLELCYNKRDMDAWLEKLKAEGDRLQREGLEHHAIAVKYYEKLEAVKELNREYDARPIYELDLVQFHNFRAKLWKLLGAEDT